MGANPLHIFQALSAASIVKGINTYTYIYSEPMSQKFQKNISLKNRDIPIFVLFQ